MHELCSLSLDRRAGPAWVVTSVNGQDEFEKDEGLRVAPGRKMATVDGGISTVACLAKTNARSSICEGWIKPASTALAATSLGTFPRNVRISERCVGGRESAVTEWTRNPIFYEAVDRPQR